jgi:hypothetical protein
VFPILVTRRRKFQALKFCHRPFPQSSSSSRFTAGAAAFFTLSQRQSQRE